MEPFVRRFIRASLIWLGVGVVLGLSMVYFPAQAAGFRAAHLHANLLGFVSMMIFGVAYHVLPRFTGNPLHSRRLPGVHLWLANLGLLAMVAGFLGRALVPASHTPLLHGGAMLSAIGAGLFIYNLWRTLGGVPIPASHPMARMAQPPLRAAAER